MTAGIPLFDGNTQHDMQKEQKEQHDGFTLNFRNKKGRPRRSLHTCDTLFAGEAMVLACFSFGKISEKSVEISSWFCYNLSVSLCSRAGVKNPRWQADT